MSTIQIIGLAWLAASLILAPIVGRLLKRNEQLRSRVADLTADEFTVVDQGARRRHPSGLDPL